MRSSLGSGLAFDDDNIGDTTLHWSYAQYSTTFCFPCRPKYQSLSAKRAHMPNHCGKLDEAVWRDWHTHFRTQCILHTWKLEILKYQPLTRRTMKPDSCQSLAPKNRPCRPRPQCCCSCCVCRHACTAMLRRLSFSHADTRACARSLFPVVVIRTISTLRNDCHYTSHTMCALPHHST